MFQLIDSQPGKAEDIDRDVKLAISTIGFESDHLRQLCLCLVVQVRC